MAVTVKSTDLKDGDKMPNGQVFNGMGYEGNNLSPQLSWDNPPAGTKSFAITCYDPDAPTGSGWWHWGVANLPADLRSLPTGAGSGKGGLPAGAVQTRTDFGKAGYGGAAPPQGEHHRYQFTVYALDVDQLDVSEESSGAYLGFNLHFHTLAKASLTVIFS
jgi:Raf kinase inhibitor-like YbhB/YbcL family protein